MDLGDNNTVYVDVDDALKRVGGNKGLFIKLLGRFIDGNHLEALEGAVSGGDMEAAARFAHTLKGVSSNLSLVKVATLSADFEHALKTGGDHTALFNELKEAYDMTVVKIAEITG